MRIRIRITRELWTRCMMRGWRFRGNLYTEHPLELAIQEMVPEAMLMHRYINWDSTLFELKDLADKSIKQMLISQQIPHTELPGALMAVLDTFDELITTPAKRLNLPPVQFEVEVPDSVIQKIGITQAYKVLSESKHLHYVNPNEIFP